MTAPTTRETADHAELARLAEAKASWSLGIYKNREQADDAAKFNALDLPATVLALLSEIAALRGDLTETRVAADLLVSSLRADLRQAERQRDEARDTIASTVAKADWMQGHLSGERSSIDRETIELVVSECRAYCHLQALANQGSDQ